MNLDSDLNTLLELADMEEFYDGMYSTWTTIESTLTTGCRTTSHFFFFLDSRLDTGHKEKKKATLDLLYTLKTR